MKHPFFIMSCVAFVSACGDRVCTMEYTPAVEVTVVDSVTGAHREKDAALRIYSLDKDGGLVFNDGRYAAWPIPSIEADGYEVGFYPDGADVPKELDRRL